MSAEVNSMQMCTPPPPYMKPYLKDLRTLYHFKSIRHIKFFIGVLVLYTDFECRIINKNVFDSYSH